MPWAISPNGVVNATLCALLVSIGIRCLQLQFELDRCHAALDAETPIVASTSHDDAPEVLKPQSRGERDAADKAPYVANLFVRRAERVPTRDMANVTLVTHVTLDRAPRLARLCRSWRGPMSVSVFRRPQDGRRAHASVAESVAAADECLRRHADFHEVELSARAAYVAADGESPGLEEVVPGAVNRSDMYTHYPFNVQRNAALDGATGEWVLLLDVDFVMAPSEAARERVFSARFHEIRTRHSDLFPTTDLTIAVVPAVETVNSNVSLPLTYDALQASLRVHEATAFYGHYCQTCHRPTNIDQYVSLSRGLSSNKGQAKPAPYEVRYREGYEPYVVAARSTLPRYDERFVGRGWDKMSFFYELNAQGGRKYVVLPPPMPFLVHAGRGDLPTNYTREYMDRQRENVMLMHNFKAAVERRHQSNHAQREMEERGRIKAGLRVDPADAEAAMVDALNRKPSDTVPPWMRDEPNDGNKDTPKPRTEEQTATRDASDGPSLIDWATMSSSTGGPKACVSAFRGESLDNVTTTQVEAALSYACERIDCRPLLLGGLRHFPDTLLAHADWAFDRYMTWAVESRGEDPEQACYFNGAARLVTCAQQCFGCEAVPDAPEERVGRALEWVCGPDGLQDCGAILAAVRGNSNRTLHEKASVLFSAYYMVNRCTHLNPDEACYFGGAGRRVQCSELPD